MESDIMERLKASVRMDAVNGDHHERAVCARQMREAADEIERLRTPTAEGAGPVGYVVLAAESSDTWVLFWPDRYTRVAPGMKEPAEAVLASRAEDDPKRRYVVVPVGAPPAASEPEPVEERERCGAEFLDSLMGRRHRCTRPLGHEGGHATAVSPSTGDEPEGGSDG